MRSSAHEWGVIYRIMSHQEYKIGDVVWTIDPTTNKAERVIIQAVALGGMGYVYAHEVAPKSESVEMYPYLVHRTADFYYRTKDELINSL